HVQEVYVTQYKTNTRSETVAGVTNAQRVATYTINNTPYMSKLFRSNSSNGFDEVFTAATGGFLLDSVLNADPQKGRIKLRLANDVFSGGAPFTKGKEYYFSITSATVNNMAISKSAADSTVFIDSSGNAFEEFESPIFTVVFNEDEYSPALGDVDANHSGYSNGAVKFMPIDTKSLTGDDYKVEFFKDTKGVGLYTPYWRLTDKTTGRVLIDSSKVYNYDTTNYTGKTTDGFIVKVKPVSAAYDETDVFYSNSRHWFKEFNETRGTGIFYLGTDIAQAKTNDLRVISSKATTADKLKDIKLKFGKTGKAYRYISGYKGTVATRKNFAVYAAGLVSTDTSYKMQQKGFVDVPFTAWGKDPVTGQEKQLAVGFIERASILGGTPDGVWNPKDSLLQSGELILIFDKDYSNDSSTVYTGTAGNWADVFVGYAATGLSSSDSAIARSPWFNTLYAVGFERKYTDSTFVDGDVLSIPMTVFPYSSNDVFEFSTKKQGVLTESERRDLFNKITVFPNPLFAYNPATSYNGGNTDEPFVTFSNLPTEVTVKVYTLSGTLVRTLRTSNKSVPTSPFLKWNLQNENGLRVASGMYLATIDCPGFGQKVLKFAIIMPQKQIQKY
ncbi:MAG: hypothetical protein Q8903_00630, partial [Bacteroidota bacterium]|nr:hypothetical protein [Bacteroidota bacterium]